MRLKSTRGRYRGLSIILLSSFVVGAASCATTADEVPRSRAPDAVDVSVDAPVANQDTIAPASIVTNVTAGENEPQRPSVTATVGYEKIFQKPDTKAPLIGLFRAGQSVPLREPTQLTVGPGGATLGHCKGGWYAVEPRGYVCLGAASTLDASDVRARAAREVLPNLGSPLPFHVGIAVGSPRYLRIPTRDEQRKLEKDLDPYLEKLERDAPADIDRSPAKLGPSDAFQKYVELVKPKLSHEDDAYAGRKIAWVREFDAEGRTWLVTPDLMLVPKDKVRTFAASTLQGVDLRARPDLALPLGFAWTGDTAKLEKTQSGAFIETGEAYPRHAFVPVTGELVRGKGGTYWATRDGYYVRNDQLTVMKQRTDRPQGVGKKDKWLHVRITWGTLVAYEGDTPVYATAISPGQDGITERSHGHTTKRGVYNVGWKLFSANMSGVEKKAEWAVDEVPFVAYYKESYAVHGAWWHDDFGRPKSHGCVNVAPADAGWLFRWLDPVMPRGWYAVAAYYPDVKSAVVDIKP